jgi:hypothetical protein
MDTEHRAHFGTPSMASGNPDDRRWRLALVLEIGHGGGTVSRRNQHDRQRKATRMIRKHR